MGGHLGQPEHWPRPVRYDRREAAIERLSALEGLPSLVVPALDTAPTDRFAEVTLKNVAAEPGLTLDADTHLGGLLHARGRRAVPAAQSPTYPQWTDRRWICRSPTCFWSPAGRSTPEGGPKVAWWIRRRAPQPARQPSTSDDPFGDALDAAGGMFEEIHSYAGPFGDGLEFALADQPGIDAAYVWDRDERAVVRLTGDRLIRSPGAAAPAGGTGPAAAPRASA